MSVNTDPELNFSGRRNLPVILQAESAECGLACLAMILNYHGYKVSLRELRATSSVSLKGIKLTTLSKLAVSFGLNTRPVRCSLDQLKNLRLPAILHWNLDHFVVLKKVTSSSIIIHDPGFGKKVLRLDEASNHFTGVALEAIPDNGFRTKRKDGQPRISDLWHNARGLWHYILQIALLTLGLQVFVIIGPIINQLIIDDAIEKSNLNLLYAIILGFGLLRLIQIAIEMLRSWIGLYFSSLFSLQVTSNLMRHVLSLKPEFFERRHIGDVMSRLNSIRPIQELITQSFVTIFLDGLMVIVTLIVMFLYSGVLASLVLAVVAIRFTIRSLSFIYVLRLEEDKIQKDADLEAVSLESIRGIRAVKIFGKEFERLSLWKTNFVNMINVSLKLERYNIAAKASNSLANAFLDLTIFLLGAMLIIKGTLTLGMFFAFQAYRTQFAEKSDSVLNLFFEFRTAGLHMDRISELITAETDASSYGVKKSAGSVNILGGSIEFQKVNFRYADTESNILEDVSLKIEAGERVAIIGPTGSGKSTLLKLMINLHSPSEGKILYDGHELSEVGINELRDSIGVVMQDDRLFAGSIYDNISFFESEPNIERVENVTKAAQLHNEIISMPMGYHSRIGDMGSALSGGQIQRILLARAIYKDPSILFLDEGTANLDTHVEGKITSFLRSLQCTQVVIAHRLEAIKYCDRIFEVSEGKVTEVTKTSMLQNQSLLESS